MPSSSEPALLPDGTHIGRTALRVADRDRMVDFYRTVVGLEVLRETDEAATLGVEDRPLLVLEDASDAPPRQRSGAGLYHNAFRVPSRAALGDALGRIRQHWRLDGASDHRVSEALYFTDPEDNGVEMYQDFPRSEWPTTDDGRVAMDTDPLDLDRVAAAAAGDDRAPSGTVIGHVHLEVSSLETFEAFYVEALGFEVMATLPGALFVSAGGYHHHVGANTWHRRSTPAQGRGLSWFEVVLPERRDLDAIREQLATGERSVIETDRGIEVTDPDGVSVRVRPET